jgi:hypothetical protein
MTSQPSSLHLELSPKLGERLSAEAHKLGLSIEEYALRLLEEPSSKVQGPRTGAEVVAYWRREGVLGSRPDLAGSPEDPAPMLRRTAERRPEE